MTRLYAIFPHDFPEEKVAGASLLVSAISWLADGSVHRAAVEIPAAGVPNHVFSQTDMDEHGIRLLARVELDTETRNRPVRGTLLR